jgi:vitamin-K-epoxide reductase (warfarin-sensitive)
MILQLSIFGLLLSSYASYVIYRSNNSKYKPLCDITEKISCTKAFSSKHGKLAILPNPWYGIAYYSVILSLVLLQQQKIIFILSIFMMVITLYLAYISYYKQRNFCIVCTGIYLVNFITFFYSYSLL